MTSSVKIEVTDVEKVYRDGQGGRVRALDRTSFTVSDGEFFGIIGPSGCGKSTLLRILAGLIEPTAGEFRIENESSGPENAMVFQDDALFPWRSVRENIEFGLEMRNVPKDERARTSSDYIAKVGLDGFEDAYPHQLSGGMKQRVNIARAYANDPEVLLMDEPLGALDAQTRSVMEEELMRIWADEHKTVLYVTHSLEEAILMSDRILLLTARPGRIKSIYDVDIDRPRTHETRQTEQFNELYSDLWSDLREEVQSTMST